MEKPDSRRLPSHTTIVAYLALFAALATGGAYAAGKIGSDDIKDDAVLSKHIKKKQVKSADVAQGAGLEAIAYVDGHATPAFQPEVPERGFESVTHGDTGVYCLMPSAGIDPLEDPPVVTVEYNSSQGEPFMSMWDIGTGVCDDDEYEIQTYDDAGGATDDAAFVVMVP